jgi:PBP1b-binding outer membrane lipoprotein LpoB
MTTRWIAIAASAFLLAGCGKKTETPSPTIATQSVEPAPAGQPQTSNAPPASVQPVQADTGPLLDQLTWSLRQYCMATHSVPSSLDVVVAAGFITNMPPAPAGKKYSIVPKKLQVILVKE